ncbi:MAG: class I SAM-dependent methyltransferase [Oscillospiraceae bacterium]|nr:class I SAM-dependent methyltransferase [Oscillospiraceae bacterium]
MDLHDFDDVAENYDLYLGEMYKDEDNHAGFREFYLDFAKRYGGGGVIDIACGTGAVLLTLAEHGIMADGTDLSEAMCRVADEKAKSKGFHLNIFPANMTEFRSGKKYSCAIIARSGFMHLLTPELQRAALLNIRENLSDGGMLTFNTFDPDPFFQAQQMHTKDTEYTYRLEYTNKSGCRERIYNAISYDPSTQIMSGNWKFETLDDNGNAAEERIRPLKMRQTYRQEMKYLLELTGYRIVNVYGGYHKESSAGPAKNVIWCVQKKDSFEGNAAY